MSEKIGKKEGGLVWATQCFSNLYLFIYLHIVGMVEPKKKPVMGATRLPHVCELRRHARPCHLKRDYWDL